MPRSRWSSRTSAWRTCQRSISWPARDGLHPWAKRILLINHGDWIPGTHPAILALAVGKIDYHLYAPWYPLERGLYPAISEFLAA